MENKTKIFIEKAGAIHKNKYDYSLVDYKNNRNKIIIICNTHGQFNQEPKNHLNGHGCPKCASYIKSGKNLNNEIFIKKSSEIHNNFYDYSLVKYKNSYKKVKIICPIHGVFEQIPYHHYTGHRCQKCSNNVITKNDFLEKSINKHNLKYDYSLIDYIDTKTKIKIICPIHGIFEQRPRCHYNGAGCPNCKSSKGEAFILKFLKEHNINFKTQKRFNNCRIKFPLPFDFYLPDKNICIEYDGKQHYESVEFWGGISMLEKRKNRDVVKTKYCNENNIKLIRIKYNDDKLKILNNIL